MEKFYNMHHIVPSSMGGSGKRQNIVKLDTRHHKALHMLFNNGTPVDQIKRIMNINSTALTREIKHDINQILLRAGDTDYIYVNGVLKPNF